MLYFAPIVEGHGEVAALPALLHRIAADAGFPQRIQVNTPIRVVSGSFVNDDNQFRRHVTLAAEKAKARSGSVLIVIGLRGRLSRDTRSRPASPSNGRAR
jgi:hypothetical protein